MKFGIRRGLLMGLAVLGMVGADVAPGGATVPVNAGALVVSGGGTISPGLHATPARQSFTFTSFTVTGLGTVHKQTIVPSTIGGPTSNCAASGNDGVYVPNGKTEVPGYPGDTLAAGIGLGTWACFSGPLAGKSGLLYYWRVGPAVQVLLTKHVPVKDVPMGTLTCVFVANTLPPALVTSYSLTCAGWAADVL